MCFCLGYEWGRESVWKITYKSYVHFFVDIANVLLPFLPIYSDDTTSFATLSIWFFQIFVKKSKKVFTD